VVVLVVVMLVVLLGFAALVIDVGYAYYAHRQLQASADAAALAGAQELPNAAMAEAVARQYAASDGAKNEHRDLEVTTTVTTKCIQSVPGCDPVNTVVVLERAPAKTFFAGLLGIDTFTVKAKATAMMSGGKPRPAHIVIIFDRTNSMNDACTQGGSKVSCARSGVNAFLTQMDPAYDQVGLVAFPPGSGGSHCSFTPKSTDGPTTDYDRYPNGYTLVPLSSDYKTSASSPLNPSSPLVSTVNCIRAGGTTHTAAAIDRARQMLAAAHDPEAQDVIIFFTDGEANYGPCTDNNNDEICENNSSPYRSTPCRQAVTSADLAAAAGVWVYGIAYDAAAVSCWGWRSTGTGTDGRTCNKRDGFQFRCAEQPSITATAAVQGIASDSTKFFNQPNPGDLTTIFKRIALDLTGARLVDDDLS
jgi:hypothetical protein